MRLQPKPRVLSLEDLFLFVWGIPVSGMHLDYIDHLSNAEQDFRRQPLCARFAITRKHLAMSIDTSILLTAVDLP